ncbi:hypothetical protein RB595_008052 [Gaeumannomyces hyphopodioides]
MLTPCITRPVDYLYALGNTPAISLARAVPHGVNADILLLGCGDVRNLLYTAYAEKGMPPRKLDITCCDSNDFILARNAIFLSFLIDRIRPGQYPQLRSLYYDLFVDEAILELFRTQLHRLAEAAGSWESWHGSPYGPVIKFADHITFVIFRRTLSKLSYAASTDGVASSFNQYQASLKASWREMQRHTGVQGSTITALRSAAPLSLRLSDESIVGDVTHSYNKYWNKATNAIDSTQSADRANPLFALPIARGESVLHSGTDPVTGFHLATAFAPLMHGSPIRMESAPRYGISKSNWAMQELFREWTQALQETVSHGRLVVRFVSTDALTLCHTLRYCAAKRPERPSAGLYRRQLSAQALELDQGQYGGAAKDTAAPVTFDAIDSSNLADSLGALNILSSAGPLLKPTPWAALSTEVLRSPAADERESFAKLLPGGTLALAHMLGFTVAEYWTNTTVAGGGLEVIGAMLKGTDGGPARMFPGRMTWVPDAQLSGHKDTTPSRLKLDTDTATGITWRVYADMFEAENVENILRSTVDQALLRRGGMPQSHRGTFVALLKALMSTVDTDWDVVNRALIEKIYRDTAIIMGNNYIQELVTLMHLHGVFTEQWLLSELKTDPRHSHASYQKWARIPEIMAVTLVVPLGVVKEMFPTTESARPALSFQVTLKSGRGAWVNYFGCIQMSIGAVEVQGSPQSEDFKISVRENRDGWKGSSPVVVSFYCPTSALQVEPISAIISLNVQPTLQAIKMLNGRPGDPKMVFQTNLGDSSAVFFSKYLPGHSAHPVISTHKELTASPGPGCDSRSDKSFSLSIDAATGEIAALTGRVDITDDEGKELLAEKAPIQLRQASPFIIEVVFGSDDLVYPLHFKLPVEKQGSRTRIARTSCYVEVIAPLANPTESEPLQGFMHPMAIAARASNKEGIATMPSVLSCTLPYINLDMLPSLWVASHDKEPIRWLTTLASHMFSNRERRIREQIQNSDISDALKLTPAGTARTNFKDSLFSMFMVASGLQGGQTGLFALEKPDGGAGNAGVQMLVVISAMRLDCANGTVVADAAVLPLTRSLLMSDPDLRAFLALSQSFEVCYLKVDDAELALWRRALPAMAERCRTWEHDAETCEYSAEGTSLPLPEEGGVGVPGGSPVFCSCGRGRLPEDFVSIPQWDEAARPHTTRVALGLVFATPFVEEVVDQVSLAQLRAMRDGDPLAPGSPAAAVPSGDSLKKPTAGLPSADSTSRHMLPDSDKCLTCGALDQSPLVSSPLPLPSASGVVNLSRCNGCRRAKYCSKDCQRKDWKRHKVECIPDVLDSGI